VKAKLAYCGRESSKRTNYCSNNSERLPLASLNFVCIGDSNGSNDGSADGADRLFFDATGHRTDPVSSQFIDERLKSRGCGQVILPSGNT
jgi:hypothetical protein